MDPSFSCSPPGPPHPSNAPAPIPLVDLGCQHAAIAPEIMPPLLDAMAQGCFTGGTEVARFESAFATFCGRRQCVAVANGTDALELMLRGAGIGVGDDVLVPANTFVATVG